MSELLAKNGVKLSLYALVEGLPAGSRTTLLENYDIEKFKKIFNDSDMMSTIDCLFDNDLNVSRTARKMYMHRNTLIYRLNKFKEITSLDVRIFSDAVIFILIYTLYRAEKEG